MTFDGRKGAGLAKVPQQRRREIARMGNEALRAAGREHRFTHDEAVAAGR